jgi:hypothetical protein
MADIDRNFVLELLADEADVQQDRVTLYTKRRYPARREVAGSRAYTLALLLHAVECGLLEQLAEEDAREGQPTIHDVMTGEELAEADREADAYADAMSEAGWGTGEGAPF